MVSRCKPLISPLLSLPSAAPSSGAPGEVVLLPSHLPRGWASPTRPSPVVAVNIHEPTYIGNFGDKRSAVRFLKPWILKRPGKVEYW